MVTGSKIRITYTGDYRLWQVPGPCGKKRSRHCVLCTNKIVVGATWFYAYRVRESDGRQETTPSFPVCKGCAVRLGAIW